MFKVAILSSILLIFTLFLCESMQGTNSCSKNEFRCPKDGSCIPIIARCNGTYDCTNLEDEADCTICSGNTFRCSDGKFIDGAEQCNGLEDCEDGSDEAHCRPTCPAARPYACSSGTRCIASSLLCNGFSDCRGDDSDELNCSICLPGLFHCKTNTCIDKNLVCDGVKNCCCKTDDDDNSDEESCEQQCPEDRQFKCKSVTQCISNHAVCDGANNCLDASDEANCTACSGGAFHCPNRQCITDDELCNGIDNCEDNSDEVNCKEACPLDRPFRCKDSTRCFSARNQCDGKKLCDDGSDESSCADACPAGRPYRCGNSSQCIDISDKRLCHANNTYCLNGADRFGCSPCPSNQFKCYDGACLPETARCNGNSQCANGEDERNCISCKKGAYFCPSMNSCWSARYLCEDY